MGYIHGKSNFIGDVGDTKFINPFQKNISSNNVSGFSLKWNRSPRHSIKLTFIKSNLVANDLNSKDPRRIERGYNFTTPISESMQVLVWHLIVSHPLLQINKTKW